MPPAARFKVAAVEELFKQLRFAPAKTRQRQMDAAERLVAEIDPQINYPDDFIVFRITGYRPERSATMLVGEALLPDLVNFVLLISRDLDLTADHNGREARRLEHISRELNVASKTLQRYRRQGLVCHYVRFEGDKRPRIACYRDSLEQFTQRNGARIERAAGFTRVDDDIERQIIIAARQLHAEQSLSLNLAARQLAEQFGRAHETVRLMLRRYDRESVDPIFSAPGPINDRHARMIQRAWRWGVPASRLAHRLKKTPTTIHRTINRLRGDALASVDLQFVNLPTFTLNDAAAVILSHPTVTRDLHVVLPHTDALAMIAAARQATQIEEDAELAMIAAYNFLKARAKHAINGFGQWPGATSLDHVETDLRWASMIKRRLVCSAFPSALRTIEQHLHRSLHEQPSDVIIDRVTTGIHVVAGVIEALNPSRGQRLPRICAQAMDRALAVDSRHDPESRRAMARHGTKGVPLTRALSEVTPWSWLEPAPIEPIAFDALNGDSRMLLTMRFGLDGTPPRTCAQLAKQLNRTAASIARLLAKAQRELRRR